MQLKPALFLDRDGVIIEEVAYLCEPSQVLLTPGCAEAISQVNHQGIPVVVVTNQAGVARGYFPESRVAEVHERIDGLLSKHRAHIDRYYYCPHHPTEGVEGYRLACQCRKPRPGMLMQAARELRLDLSLSFLVGDKLSDLEAGAAAGCRTILVRTGYGAEVVPLLEERNGVAATVANNLAEAVNSCLPHLLGLRHTG